MIRTIYMVEKGFLYVTNGKIAITSKMGFRNGYSDNLSIDRIDSSKIMNLQIVDGLQLLSRTIIQTGNLMGLK